MFLNFTGDISITGLFSEKINNNTEIFSEKIADVIKKSDFTTVNLEGPVCSSETRESKNIILKSPERTIDYLSARNINVYNLANNHILDYKEKGLSDTVFQLEKNKCLYFGAGKRTKDNSKGLILEKDDLKVALFGITKIKKSQQGSLKDFWVSVSHKELKTRIKAIKNEVDYIIINYHGGEEHTNLPSPAKRRKLKRLSELKGVDCIIAHHSHSFQGYEKYKNKYIFYSLGNFLFDIQLHKFYPYSQFSAILNMKFEKENLSFTFIPYEIDSGCIKEKDPEVFSSYVNRISDFSRYKRKWQKECYRFIFRNKKNLMFAPDSDYQKNSLKNKSFFHLLVSKKFYKKTVHVLKNNVYRSIYINAVLYKIKIKLKLIDEPQYEDS